MGNAEFRAQVRDYVSGILATNAAEYIGDDTRLLDVALDAADGHLSVKFTSAKRPDALFEWSWRFPRCPPSDHAVTQADLRGYGGWVLVMLQEAVITRQKSIKRID